MVRAKYLTQTTVLDFFFFIYLFLGTQISRLPRALTFYFSDLPNLVFLLLSKYQNIMVTVNPHMAFIHALSE